MHGKTVKTMKTTLSISVKLTKYVKPSRLVQPQQSRHVSKKYTLELSP